MKVAIPESLLCGDPSFVCKPNVVKCVHEVEWREFEVSKSPFAGPGVQAPQQVAPLVIRFAVADS
jgi:hypothetical protein